MKMADIRNKPATELQKILTQKRQSLGEAVLELHAKDVKNVRGIRALKKEIAQILTALNAPIKEQQ